MYSLYSLKSKKTIYIKDIIILMFIHILIIIILLQFYRLYNIKFLKLDDNNLLNITTIQVTISILSVTIMTLFFNDIDNQILGIPYKIIFFGKEMLGILNIPNLVMLLIIFMVLSITSSIVIVNINYIWFHQFAKISIVFTLYCSFMIMIYLIYLGLIEKYKKSIIYIKLLKKFQKYNKEQIETIYMNVVYKISTWLFGDTRGLYERLKDNLDVNFSKKKQTYNMYIREDFIVLIFIYYYIDKFEDDKEKQKLIEEKIIKNIKWIVNSDKRDNNSLKKILENFASEYISREHIENIFSKINI